MDEAASSYLDDDDEVQREEGESWLEAWERKLPLTTALNEKVDGRSISGLKKRFRRLHQQPAIRADGNALQSYHIKIGLARDLFEDNGQMDRTERNKNIATMIEAKAVLKESFKHKLAILESQHMIANGDYP